MSFWENASGATKAVIVVGGLLIVAFGGMYATGTGLYADAIDDQVTQDPGLGAAAPAAE
jgi:hypothetical protein